MNEANKYSITKQLGEGSFATVYLAEDKLLKRKVALKVFRGKADNEEFVTRFNREASICQRLRHENIINIFDVISVKDSPAIVMEYIDAGDLAALIKEETLTIPQSIQITCLLADALEYLHSKGILHRDIKPANIMIRKPMTPVLMDFNLAFSRDLTMLTKEGSIVGTPIFMAPELFYGYASSESTDVYALGLILYDMVTNGGFSKSQNSTNDINNRLSTRPSLLNAAISPELDKLILWTTNNDPEFRCPAMKDFLRALLNLPEINNSTLNTSLDTSIATSNGPSQNPKKLAETLPEKTRSRQNQATTTKRWDKKQKSKTVFRSFLLPALFCLCIILMAAWLNSISDNPKQTIPLETEEASGLLQLAVLCDANLPDFDNFQMFFDSEEKLFNKTNGNSEVTSDHCSKLRTILEKMPGKNSFTYLLEYKYRLRQEIKGKDLSGNINLLEKSLSVQCKNISETLHSKQGDLAVLHYILCELWPLIKSDQLVAEKHMNELTKFYFTLPMEQRKNNGGYSFFHSLSLCQCYLGLLVFPKDNDILTTIAPYECHLLSQFRKETVDTKTPYDEARYIDKLEQATTETFKFLVNSIQVKSSLNIKGLHDSAFEIVEKNRWVPPENFATNLKELLLSYSRHIDRAWFLMNISDKNTRLSLLMMELIRECFQLFEYKYYYLVSNCLKDLNFTDGKNSQNPKFLLKCFPFWQEAVLNYIHSDTLSNDGYAVSASHNMVRIIGLQDSPALTSSYENFMKRAKKSSLNAGIAINALSARPVKIPPPTYSEFLRSFNSLMSMEANLQRHELRGWTIVISALSNQFFLQLKVEERKKERTQMSLSLLKKLTKYTDSPMYTLRNDPYRTCSALNTLKNGTLLHCCDSFIENGRDIFADEPELCAVLKAEEFLKYKAAQYSGWNSGGSFAARKLLKNEALKVDDIPMDPFTY